MSREQYREHLEMFQAVMQVPHGDLTAALQVHKQVCDRNPLFYAKFAVWFMDNGTVRDHKVAFLQTLFNAKEPELRETAWMLLQDAPLELVYRVVDKKYPRSMRSAVINKLANEDSRTMQFQILRAKKPLKRLIKRMHVPTSKSDNENLQAIGKELFTKDTELRAVFKQLSATEDPEEIKKLLQKSRLPAYIAVSSIKVRNPKVMRALIDNMSPAELLQSLNTLGRLKVLEPNMQPVMDKIQRGINDNRIQAMRVHNIRKYLDPELVPPAIFDLLSKVTVQKIRKAGKLKGKTSIHIDLSGSMEQAIKIAREAATTLAMASETPPTIYTASTTPSEVKPRTYTSQGLEDAFRLLRPAGGTPLGAGIALMNRKNEECDTLIIITDEGENTPPFFADEYRKMSFKPQVIILRIPTIEISTLGPNLNNAGIPFEQLNVDKVDQYSLDQIVRLVGKSPFDTVVTIMSQDLPQRPPELRVPDYWKKKEG
jgi:hypothetical protein